MISRKTISYFLFIFVLLESLVYAGSLEDLRNKVGYKSPVHSGREKDYIKVSIPKLKANLSDYRGEFITFNCLFRAINTDSVDHSIKNRPKQIRRSANKYIGFIVIDPKQFKELHYLYYPKGQDKEDLLYEIHWNTPIKVWGKVIDIDEDDVFIDVNDFEIK